MLHADAMPQLRTKRYYAGDISQTHKDLTSDRYRDLRRPKKVTFFCNGDRYFKGKLLFITPHRYLSFQDLLGDLTGKLPTTSSLPYGVRQIYTPVGGRRIRDIENLEDGKEYVCAGFETFKPINYGTQSLDPWSNGRPHRHTDNPSTLDLKGVSALPNGSLGSHDLSSTPRSHLAGYPVRRPIGHPNDPYSLRQDDKQYGTISKPKVITVVRAGRKPYANIKILLNRRSVQSYERLLVDISESFGPKWKNNKVRSLYTLTGREVLSVSDFFRGDSVFVAVGNEKISFTDVQEIIETLYPDSQYSKSLLRTIEKQKRKAKQKMLQSLADDNQEIQDKQELNRVTAEPKPKRAALVRPNKQQQQQQVQSEEQPVTKKRNHPTKAKPTESTDGNNKENEPKPSNDKKQQPVDSDGSDSDKPKKPKKSNKSSNVTKPPPEPAAAAETKLPEIPQPEPIEKPEERVEEESDEQQHEEPAPEPEQKTKKQVREEKQMEQEKQQQAKREADEKAKQDIYKAMEEKVRKEQEEREKQEVDGEQSEKRNEDDVQSKKDGEEKTKSKLKQAKSKAHRTVPLDEIKDRYDIGRTLGDGNFALVKMCQRRDTGYSYAMKVIDKSKLKGKEHMIDNEIAIMKACNHENLVRLYEEYETTDEIYLVLELVKGGDLFDAITQSVKFTEPIAAKMTLDMTNALFYLHSRGIVHRDLKPENLMVLRNKDESITLKLGDFGLAVEIKAPIFTICGTPTYVAPEILSEVGYGLEVDMWAVGVITYILLCGFPPFRSPDRKQTELFEFIKAGLFEYLSPYWDDASSESKDLISHLLVVDKKKRYTAIDVLCHEWIITQGGSKKKPKNFSEYQKNLREELNTKGKENLAEWRANRAYVFANQDTVTY